MQFTATYKYADISPLKARLVADLVRGKHVNDALQILRSTHKRASHMVNKVLCSAIANADQSLEADMEGLRIREICVDVGPTRRKRRPASRGRVILVRGRTSHIHVVLDDQK
jgi:large subunit ribosomal protein L22